MREPRSRFIKRKIKGLKFGAKSRKYVEDLLVLEDGIRGKVRGFAGNVRVFGLKQKYPKEFNAILKELRPGEYRKLVGKRKKDRKLKSKLKQRKVEEWKRNQAKRIWKKYGGKV